MLISKVYQSGVKFLSSYVDNANLEVRLILCQLLNCTYIEIITNKKDNISLWQYCCFKRALWHRKSGYPLAYILKQKDFWNSSFYVNKHVLIPRCDSETLIVAILKEYGNTQEKLNILELGVGSGCLVLSLLQEYLKSTAFGVDISKKALKVAKINSIKLALNNRITFIKSDIFRKLKTAPQDFLKKFDIIISNPPYIAFDDDNIDKNVKKYEPQQALYAKDNGLYFYDKIFKDSYNFLKDDGKIFVEIGFSQKQDVVVLALKYGYQLNKSYQDLGNRDRVLSFIKV